MITTAFEVSLCTLGYSAKQLKMVLIVVNFLQIRHWKLAVLFSFENMFSRSERW